MSPNSEERSKEHPETPELGYLRWLLVIIGVLAVFAYFLFMPQTDVKLDLSNQILEASPNSTLSDSFSIISNYDVASTINIQIEANDERIKFSENDTGNWHPTLDFNMEIGPNFKNNKNFFVKIEEDIPKGNYSITIMADKSIITKPVSSKKEIRIK